MFVTLLGFLLAAPLSSSAPVDFLAPQTLPAGCRLEVITVQEEVEETKVTLLFLLFMMFMVMMDIVRRPITMADTGRESRLRDRVSADLHDQTGERLQKCHQASL